MDGPELRETIRADAATLLAAAKAAPRNLALGLGSMTALPAAVFLAVGHTGSALLFLALTLVTGALGFYLGKNTARSMRMQAWTALALMELTATEP